MRTNPNIKILELQLKEDLENYVKFSIVKGPIKIKADVVPRFFTCQADYETAAVNQRSSREKLSRKRLIVQEEDTKDNSLAKKAGCIQGNVPIDDESAAMNVNAYTMPLSESNVNKRNGIQVSAVVQKKHYRSTQTMCLPDVREVSCHT